MVGIGVCTGVVILALFGVKALYPTWVQHANDIFPGKSADTTPGAPKPSDKVGRRP